ncbi:MAG: hypothetical protein AB2814_00500 [Candidatus Sedimenticola endophacoides]
MGVLLLGSALSFVNGMLYRIVPFLSWFHLQHRQLALLNMSVILPNMKELLPDRWANLQFYAYLAAVFAALPAPFAPESVSRLCGLLVCLSFLLLLSNLLRAVVRYRATLARLHAPIPSRFVAGRPGVDSGTDRG